MELDIKVLSPELLSDYLHFFDNIAFADHKEWANCYCLHFHWQSKWDGGPERSNRDRIVEHINSGLIQGYLVYWHGNVVGWCNANDKYSYSGLVCRKEICDAAETDRRVKSVVCFLVSPDMRGKGVASALLKQACDDATAEGYDYIESYPPAGECDSYAAHHGTIPFFAKQGFSVYKTFPHEVMMRKYVGGRR